MGEKFVQKDSTKGSTIIGTVANAAKRNWTKETLSVQDHSYKENPGLLVLNHRFSNLLVPERSCLFGLFNVHVPRIGVFLIFLKPYFSEFGDTQ